MGTHCASPHGAGVLLAPPGRKALGPNSYAADKRKVSPNPSPCEVSDARSPGLWAGGWGCWPRCGGLWTVHKGSLSGSGLVPPLATSQAQAALTGPLYPWNSLGSLDVARRPRKGGCILLPTLILPFPWKELMDCFSPTPSFSNKRFS